MTKVKIIRKNNSIISVECLGHTNYGVAGEDIVCSALSSIVQTALLGLMQVAGINVKYKRNDAQGELKLELPLDLSSSDRNNADMILETMLCGIADLHEGYSDFIELEA